MNCKTYVLTMVLIAIIATTSVPPTVFAQEQKYFFTLNMNNFEGFPYPEIPQAATVLQQELKDIGINLEVHFVDVSVFIQRLFSGKPYAEGGFDVGINAWSGGMDPSWMTPYFHTGNDTRHWISYNNGYFDALMDAGIKELNETKRKEIYQEANRILIDDAALLPLWYNKFYNVRNSKIQGWTNLPSELPVMAGYWTVNGKTYADNVTVIYALTTEPTDLNPLFASTGPSVRIKDFTGIDSLVYWNTANKSWASILANSWEVSEDGLAWTFHLKDNAYWQDGIKFTAEDVVWSTEAAMNPDVNGAWKGLYQSVESVEKVDDYTVKFHLKYVYPPFLYDVGVRSITAKHLFDGVAIADYKTQPSNTELAIGTGPYKMVKWVKGEYIEYEANPQWWGGPVFIDHLFVKFIPEVAAGLAAVQTGEVDILDSYYSLSTSQYADLSQEPDVIVTSDYFTGWATIELQNANPYLSNKWVRKAITLSFPRQHFVSDILANKTVACTQFLEPLNWAYDESLPTLPYNKTLAKEYMEKAGYNYAYLAQVPLDVTTIYLIPVATLVVGLVSGLAGGYYVSKRRKIPQT